MWKLGALLVAAAIAAGCVGDGVEFGGIEKPAAAPATAAACNREALKLVHKVLPKYPAEAQLFYFALQKDEASDRMILRYDVRETGETANIRFAGPPAFMRHATRQKMIRAAADALAQWKYEWVGPAAYAADCRFDLEYAIVAEDPPATN